MKMDRIKDNRKHHSAYHIIKVKFFFTIVCTLSLTIKIYILLSSKK